MLSWIEKNRWLLWAMTFFVFGFIFYVSSLSFQQPVPGPPSLNAIVYHTSVFFALAFFLLATSLWREFNAKIFVVCLGIAVSYAILDELHQVFVPGRFMSLHDIAFDSVGIVLASLVYSFVLYKQS